MKRFLLLASVIPIWVAPIQAQSNWGTSAGVAIALTSSWSGPGTVAKDDGGKPIDEDSEEGGPAYSNDYTVETVNRDGQTTKSVQTSEYYSKAKSYRWGNADIILALIDQGVIPEKGRSPF